MHKPSRITDWCKIYSFKEISSAYSQRIRVRVNQQLMFSIYSSINRHVIVDLIGDSLSLLTSNRDGVTYDLRHKLNKLIEEIFDSPNKIHEAEDHTQLFRGVLGMIHLKGVTKPKKIKLSQLPLDLLQAAIQIPEETQLTPATSPGGSFTRVQELIDGYSIMITNKTNRTIPDKWIPGTMSKTAYKLLDRWARLAQAIGTLLERQEEVSVGFLFSSTERAMYKKSSEYGHVLLINPVIVGETRFLNYWDASNESFFEMAAVMVHELCHIDYPNHNEGYAGALTYAMGKVLNNQSLLKKVRKETR